MADDSPIPPRYRKYWRLYWWSPLSIVIMVLINVATPRHALSLLLDAVPILVLLTSVLIIRKHHYRLKSDVEAERAHCPFCGYRLEDADANTCSECGGAVTRSQALLIDQRYLRLYWGSRVGLPIQVRRMIGKRFRLFFIPRGMWPWMFLGIWFWVHFSSFRISTASRPITTEFMVLKILSLLSILALHHVFFWSSEHGTKKTLAKRVAKNHLALHPDAANPASLRTMFAISKGDLVLESPGFEELWLEYGPLPWHVVDFDPETGTIQSVTAS